MKNELNITLIAAGCVITGDVIVDHGVSCFGLCNGGMISTRGLLHVGDTGLIRGATQGEHVRIDGRVDGDVHARDSLEINGHVSGDIFYGGTIRLGPGATINGTLKRVPRMLTIEAAPDALDVNAAAEEPTPGPAASGAVTRTAPSSEKTESNVTELHRTAVF
jgi:cytoskeletal protein CcmA (bactofilin family)